MDGDKSLIPQSLYALTGGQASPVIFDVRMPDAFDADVAAALRDSERD